MPETHTMRLSDGRDLGYDDIGDTDAPPVLFMHGAPGSRLYWRLVNAPHGRPDTRIRLIAPDRPGIGLSSPEPQRSIGSFAFDIARLMDELGIERFGVFGFSGGSPYALAVASFLSERVSAVALLCPWADFSEDDLFGSLDERLQHVLTMSAEGRWARAGAIAQMLGPSRFVHTMAEHVWAQVPRADRLLLSKGEIRSVAESMLKETVSQGIEGARLDLDLLTRKWDFPTSEVRAPVLVYEGSDDSWAPPSSVAWVLGQLPNAVRRELPTAGHFGPLLRDGRRVLDELVAEMAKPGQAGAATPMTPETSTQMSTEPIPR